jgi:hypothetical protein
VFVYSEPLSGTEREVADTVGFVAQPPATLAYPKSIS